MNWAMRRINPQYFAIRNLTGSVASEVVMTVLGPVVAGPLGQAEDWRLEVPSIAPGAEVADVFTRAWGAGTPILDISWKGPDLGRDRTGAPHSEQVEIPFRSFNRPDLRSPIPRGFTH